MSTNNIRPSLLSEAISPDPALMRQIADNQAKEIGNKVD